MKVHLVDGTYELFRAHFGAPAATGPGGREVGATRGLLRSLRALLREDGVTHVAVAFDHVIESFRNRLFPGYKTADGVPEALLAQFPLAERAAGALGLVVWPMVELEADDALATAAARLAAMPEVEQVLLCTPDKDLAQCVRGRRVVALDRMRRRILDEDGVRERFGVGPGSIPDWLALVGDAADGIPGLPRWGERSASRVLGRYGRLESIPDDAGAWEVEVRGAAGLAASLRAHREEAALYRTLAALRTDAPLEEGLDDLRWRGERPEEMQALRGELGEGPAGR
ncbi:MAG TPA: 5'-3' exonuclease H3TH domain-containing protein [Anaeromyxobacteraceae bacterium]|nr:5'-3' exonuclease H3TH domain-containing protein [Anaeromyxobacteraceae bacterium]